MERKRKVPIRYKLAGAGAVATFLLVLNNGLNPAAHSGGTNEGSGSGANNEAAFQKNLALQTDNGLTGRPFSLVAFTPERIGRTAAAVDAAQHELVGDMAGKRPATSFETALAWCALTAANGQVFDEDTRGPAITDLKNIMRSYSFAAGNGADSPTVVKLGTDCRAVDEIIIPKLERPETVRLAD